MSKLSKMLLHQAGIFSRQSSPGLSELMINASKRIIEQGALLGEKKVEIDECDLRCAELESVIKSAHDDLVTFYQELNPYHDVRKIINKLGEMVDND